MTMRAKQAIGVGCVVWAMLASAAMAQHGRGMAPLPRSAPAEAAQFDFLVGQWELVAEPHVSGLAARVHGRPKLPGLWKCWRALDGWGVEDEIRLTDASGNPVALTLCVRVYDAQARRWSLASVEAYRGQVHQATAEWRDAAMHQSGGGTDAEGKAYVTRTRFYDISADRFRFQQDRSYDGGKTWTDGYLRIEAKRVATTASR